MHLIHVNGQLNLPRYRLHRVPAPTPNLAIRFHRPFPTNSAWDCILLRAFIKRVIDTAFYLFLNFSRSVTRRECLVSPLSGTRPTTSGYETIALDHPKRLQRCLQYNTQTVKTDRSCEACALPFHLRTVGLDLSVGLWWYGSNWSP